jgi:filamentous hemagglutinin family protein
MNRNRYRLVFNPSAGTMVPAAETARGRGKAVGGAGLAGVVLAAVLSHPAQAEMPVARPGVAFTTAGQAGYQVNANQAFVNQVGDKSILNWQSFNVSAGNNVQFRQVDSLATNNPVAGASFISLNRIWDINPSVIAGSLSQAAGQKANVIMVNSNGIAFMSGSQVNLNSFTASSLNLADNFVTNGLLGDKTKPQFQKALDGSDGGGFIKVFEGARITAGSEGRVMLIAPTVVNQGRIEAPGGQVILAAGAKVYLRSVDDVNLNVRGLLVEVDSPTGLSDFANANASVKDGQLDGQQIALTSPAQDLLGHATNLGELSAPRGNVTMVGYAVNQSGIARATTSVVANGSVYLMAKDSTISFGSSVAASRGGQVVLGANSRTEVLPETGDGTTSVDGTTGTGLAQASEVRVVGQTVSMGPGAAIVAPAGKVDLIAVDNPSTLLDKTTIDQQGTFASSTARVFVADGAVIDVAGLTDVQVSAARNAVEVQLRGDELKDSPINQQGPIRGQTAYVDVNAALDNANAGKSTLIAKDSLLAYQALQARTVAERSTAGGRVNILSQGEAIVEAGASIDLSGGSLTYTPANVKTTLLTANGKLVDIAAAKADTRYDGIATRLKIDYGRWNKTEVIDLGQSFLFDPGYVEGKDAGSLSFRSMGTAFMQADILGRTTVGARQQTLGVQPKGATLSLGTADVGPSESKDYKLNQTVVIDRTTASLPTGFGMADALPDALKNTLAVNAALVAKDKVANLNVYTNQAAEVRSALRAPQGGGITVVANDLLVNADIAAPSGSINLAAGNNTFQLANDPKVKVATGVQLTARGAWVNERPGVAMGEDSLRLIDGGTISLLAETRLSSTGIGDTRGTVALGQGVTLDASRGARLNAAGMVMAGKGGVISLSGFAVEGLDANVAAYGMAKGGSINLTSNRIKIGGAPENNVGTLNLDPEFFTRGGFANFALTGLDKLTVSEGTVIKPVVMSLELQPGYMVQPSGSPIESFTNIKKLDDRLREAANISLAAKQSGAGTGDLLIGQGARVEVEPTGKIALEARNTLDIEGALVAHGGSIIAVLDRSSGFVGSAVNQNSLWLGQEAVLDVSGIAITYPDNRNLTQGVVLAGGTVNLNAKTGYVIAEAGSLINVDGVAPVKLDVMNESGGLGRTIGSDAGTLSLFAEEGIKLDANLAAHGGGASNRGGALDIALARNARLENQIGLDAQARTLALAASVVPETTGLSASAPVQTDATVRARIGTDRLEAAGFDRMRFSSRDAIVLEDGLDLGAGRALPLRELTLDAARIETAGGNVTLRADALRMGNYDTSQRVGSDGVFTSTGTFTANARLLELAGDLRLRGMALSDLSGTELVQLAGVTRGTVEAGGVSSYKNSANIVSSADLKLQGQVIAPASYSMVNLSAAGKTVRFDSQTAQAIQPLSALGILRVAAADIVQAGNLWAPLGSVDLVADNTLTLAPGSLTSVAAAKGSLLPLGQIQNSASWIVNLVPGDAPKGQITLTGLPAKSVHLAGAAVNMQTGAIVDLAGGGDLQAYEFTVGPGGSRDILTDPNTYAVVTGYHGGFAPSDPQEAFSRASASAVYLSGVPGLAAGTYTLLPAHYALLPGAFAVVLGSSGAVLPNQAYTRQDGVAVAAGYLTDTRANAPHDANWQGIAVLTRDQVLARSELTLTPASVFFRGGKNLPQDAALLSVVAQDTLSLDATFRTAAATGGRGAGVDISVPTLVLDAGNPAGIDPAATHIDVAKLNALAAGSLLLGATRSFSGDSTTLAVGADHVTLTNDADHPLTAGEVILAAKDMVTLKAGSLIDAQGLAGDVGRYTIVGNGALLRAGATSATLVRSGSPDRSQGTLIGEIGSRVRAADSIVLDATYNNSFKGVSEFKKNATTVAGNLAVGATRVNFGATPSSAEGAIFTQSDLDGLNSLKSLALTSYSSFDFYGNVNVGGVDASGKPTLQNMTLQGTGLAGLNNSGNTATLRAHNLILSNPTTTTFAPAGPMGNGTLTLLADTLTLGQGDKAVQGFSTVAITANELVGAGQGTTTIAAPTTLTLSRIAGELGADQALNATGALTVSIRTSDRALAPVTALGAKWALAGTNVDFNTQVELPSGQFALNASGDLTLGAQASVDLAGHGVAFFDVTRPTWGGTGKFNSSAGSVRFVSGSKVDVSAAPGADAGTLIVNAGQGTVLLADGSVTGQALPDANGIQGAGARVEIDTATLGNFSALNTSLNSGGFAGERSLRVRNDDVTIAAGDTTRAQTIHVAVDHGKINVAGQLDASGDTAGRIELFASSDVNLQPGAKLDAVATGVGRMGGDIEVGTSGGSLNFAVASTINVAGGSGGSGGKLLLRAPRTGAGAGSDVAVSTLQSTVTGAGSVAVEAVKMYNGISTLTATGASSGAILSLATINADDNTFATNYGAIRNRLGATNGLDILSGVEVRSTGDLTLGTGSAATDWNLATSRAGDAPGVLSLRASGNLLIKSNLSDGFSAATPYSSGTTPATLVAGNSWSYRLIAGADSAAADPMAVLAAKDFSLAAGKLIRTGTGNIQVAAGQDIKLADSGSVIYTAGRSADAVPNFSAPLASQRAYFSNGGGNVDLAAQRDIIGTASTQLYSDWLFRQGRLSGDSTAYADSQGQPAWWVRFDQFRQGVATLGGGDVTVSAGGKVSNLSVSAATQGRMASRTPDATALVKTGGGTVRVNAGADLLGGQYYADNGDVVLATSGNVDSGQMSFGLPVYSIVALGDGNARVRAQNNINIHAIINPTLLVQSYGNTDLFNIGDTAQRAARKTLFSTYAPETAASLSSLVGKVTLQNARGGGVADLKAVYKTLLDSQEGRLVNALDSLAFLPPSLSITAFQGDVMVHSQPAGGSLSLLPAAQGQLELLAQNSLRINANLTLSDRDPALFASVLRPAGLASLIPGPDPSQLHAATPVHAGDSIPVRIYANGGDVLGVSQSFGDGSKGTQVNLAKLADVRAGHDVVDFNLRVQNTNATDTSVVEAGHDLVYSTGAVRTEADGIRISGPGRLDVTAGRDVSLGTSGGIVSRGDLDNANLPAAGADIQVLAGAGANGLDVAGTLNRLSARLATSPTDETALWLTRWLTGDNQLTAQDAPKAVQSVTAKDAPAQREQVRKMVFTALRTTGRDHNDITSAFAGDYTRGYAALELVFPGIAEKNADGSFKNYQGDINLFASRIKTELGGNIELLIPGGDLIVGLANTPGNLVNAGNNVLGIVVAARGDIKGFARGNMLVNQSRILTVGGGDVMLWSSEGDIDAGKGKKTASAVPPPVIKVDSQGNVTQELQGAASGSGIGALSSGGVTAGDVDLIAPKGTVNAGDAGIRAGNLNIAAQVVLGADNISVSGKSTGTPVADTSAVTASASGATAAGGDDVAKTVAALSQSVADAAKSGQALGDAFKPSFVRVEVVGFGE